MACSTKRVEKPTSRTVREMLKDAGNTFYVYGEVPKSEGGWMGRIIRVRVKDGQVQGYFLGKRWAVIDAAWAC